MKRILVVDDNKFNCAVVKQTLTTLYEVVVANSGNEALDFLKKEKADLILMDIEMPHMDGRETLKRIRQNPDWAKIPVIFLTAYTNAEMEAECLNAGADDFISKPFVPIVMLTRVARILEVSEFRNNLESELEIKTEQVESVTRKSYTDALTGLYNRAFVEKNMKELIDQGNVGALFMIDLDNFKKVNDTYGHIVGDKVLQYFGEVLKEFAEDCDMVCRLAGDEFLAFYPDLLNRDEVAFKAESIIRGFMEKMGTMGFAGVVSVSVGIMLAQGKHTFQELYNKADKALYYVKNNGKNAYRFYDEQNQKVNEVSTMVDLEYVSNMMEKGLTAKKGPFSLAYTEFKHIYDFVSRYAARRKEAVQIVMFSIKLKDKFGDLFIEDVMEMFEESMENALRTVDAGTKYSSSQYIMIFMGADLENGKKVADRVVNNFFAKNETMKDKVIIRYDIKTMETEANK